MPQQPKCPECSTDVLPSWDWCTDCGYDPEGLKPATWSTGSTLVTASAATRSQTSLMAPGAIAPIIENAQPQQIGDPDWVQGQPRRRLSYAATFGVLAAILIAVAGLVFVVLMVLNQPVGSSRADAMARPGAISGRVAAEAG